jgi:HEAT repeat protein
MMRHLLLGTCVATFVFGCHAQPPTVSGGKPVAHWLAAVNDPDARLRKAAVFKLGNIGPADAAAFPAVVAALGDREPAVQRAAIVALLKFGDQAKEAAPTLRAMHEHDPDAHVRDDAGRALANLRAAK